MNYKWTDFTTIKLLALSKSHVTIEIITTQLAGEIIGFTVITSSSKKTRAKIGNNALIVTEDNREEY